MPRKKKKKRNRAIGSKKKGNRDLGSKKKRNRGSILIGVAATLAIGWWVFNRPHTESTVLSPPGPRGLSSLVDDRAKLDKTVWAEELLAQKHERIFIHLWDNLRAASAKHKILARFPFNRLIIGKPDPTETLEQGLSLTRYSGSSVTLSHEEFERTVNELADQGFRIVQSEWHHSMFQENNKGRAKSTVSVVLHVNNPDQNRLQSIKANLNVTWMSDSQQNPVPNLIQVTDLELLERDASAAFEPLLTLKPSGSPSDSSMMNPILVYDLDRNGLSDILVGGLNRVFFNTGEGEFRQEQIHPGLPAILNTAILADFNGDSRADLIAVDARSHRLFLLSGMGDRGRFTEPQSCWPGRITLPSVMTAGDIDGDGDLDLFIGQYKQPYVKGQMPTPYYDANDGYPAYLFQNDGNGVFTDITEPAGLGQKRFRRSYGASFVDLNEDGKFDLLVSSDFAGIDIYEGNGHGMFKEVTNGWIDQRHTFGMSHVFADFNTDGKLDFFSVGMSSTTGRRLELMGLGRDEHKHIDAMRSSMSYGNRLYFATESGFEQPSFNDQVSRTGWSWGCTTFDIDNDADSDIYVVNGHQSGKSVQDYCTTFWCHDIYTGRSQTDSSVEQLFSKTMDKLIKREISWNGFEHNALLMNRGKKGFLELGFLMGIAFEGDGRVVLSDDLNNDGRQDIILVEVGFEPSGRVTQTLRVFANVINTSNHWVGIRLHEAGPHFSPIGVRVIVRTSAGQQAGHVVTGESLYGQHSSTVHFGLGNSDSIEDIEVRWPNGTTRKLENPEVDTYHLVDPPNAILPKR